MFLISITKTKIEGIFQSLNTNQLYVKPFIITIVTDNFLSKLITNENGFSIIESPLISENNFHDIVLVQVNFNRNNNNLEIFKPLISGRPIYYHINPDGEFFCSTHIRLLREAGIKICEDLKALPEYFVYRLIMPPRTLYKDIKQFLAGEKMVIELDKGQCQIKKVLRFDPPEPEKNNNSLKKITENTLNLLTESVYLLSPCKERLSIIQSGGLDSSILYQICRNLYRIDKTYSTGFPFEDPEKNLEKKYALSASKALQSRHTYYEFTIEEYLRALIKGISSAEEPMHHLQSVLLYLIFAMIPQTKNIVISGEGADSSFGSSTNSKVYRLNTPTIQMLLKLMELTKLSLLLPKRLRDRINNIIKTKTYLNKSLDSADNMLWSVGRYGSKKWVCNYFKINNFEIIEGRYSIMRMFDTRSIYDQITMISFLGGASITKSIWSKLCESHGKIIHYPYGYDNLIYYIHTIPWSLKLEKPKNILRVVARRIGLPNFIIDRPKQSFGVSVDKWGVKGGVFEPLIPLCSKVFDLQEIRKLQSLESEKAMTFWNILNYSIWKRLCINNEPVEVLLNELMGNIERLKWSKGQR